MDNEEIRAKEQRKKNKKHLIKRVQRGTFFHPKSGRPISTSNNRRGKPNLIKSCPDDNPV